MLSPFLELVDTRAGLMDFPIYFILGKIAIGIEPDQDLIVSKGSDLLTADRLPRIIYLFLGFYRIPAIRFTFHLFFDQGNSFIVHRTRVCTIEVDVLSV